MSGPKSTTQAELVREQAISWLVRVQSDRATGEDWAALADWLEESETHLAAFEEAEMLSRRIDSSADSLLKGLRAPSAKVIQFSAHQTRRPRSRPGWAGTALLAASVIALAMFGAPMLWNGYQGPLRTYQTGVGETRDLKLADGTSVRLDAASTLSARIGWGARRVTLGDGEASFDVATDAHRPFLIRVGDQTVRVVGTEFNIRHYDRSTVVTVRRGIVEIYQDDPATGPVARLTKGWALQHVQGSSGSRVSAVNPDSAFAWTQGHLICDDEPLSEIVAYLNRRYPVPIRLSGEAAARRFSGVLALDDQEEVVRDLGRYLSLSEIRSERQIILR